MQPLSLSYPKPRIGELKTPPHKYIGIRLGLNMKMYVWWIIAFQINASQLI